MLDIKSAMAIFTRAREIYFTTHGVTPVFQTAADMFFIHTIGMEVASYLSDKAASVAVVGPSRYPFEKSLGPEIGKMSMQVRNSKIMM